MRIIKRTVGQQHQVNAASGDELTTVCLQAAPALPHMPINTYVHMYAQTYMRCLNTNIHKYTLIYSKFFNTFASLGKRFARFKDFFFVLFFTLCIICVWCDAFGLLHITTVINCIKP